jgi:hypothetical protein
MMIRYTVILIPPIALMPEDEGNNDQDLKKEKRGDHVFCEDASVWVTPNYNKGGITGNLLNR